MRKKVGKCIDLFIYLCYNGIIIKVKRKATMNIIYKLSHYTFELMARDVNSNADIIDGYNKLTSCDPDLVLKSTDLKELDEEFTKYKPYAIRQSTFSAGDVYVVDLYALEKVTLDENGDEIEWETLAVKYGEIE